MKDEIVDLAKKAKLTRGNPHQQRQGRTKVVTEHLIKVTVFLEVSGLSVALVQKMDA
jgi:hypothetical protein